MTLNDSGTDLRARIARTGIGFLMLIGLMAIAVFAAGCGSKSSSGGSTASSTPATTTAATAKPAASSNSGGAASASTAKGKQLFSSTCGGCHTLKDAGTGGTTGPKLDDLKPDKARVLAALKNGGTGGGVMPKNLYTGADADAVATYVSSVAGK